ncbi:complex I subunit 5 family protein [Halomonas dongshanensis]|uniref:NADH-ubiquinone oxidoreductase n=1 Tax=Halomonas dongshanensis TaxID=2890835 RepID=A0ABT2EDQ6_9GAMM|nr:proton-conducting transporter membrane subunit [Halomonas dongshanensis]MCS2609624.1 NADH-ubiquinone oxidoreductase [Halomonas dongshanensis]
MNWRWGWEAATFAPEPGESWALLAALVLPLMLGGLAALRPPRRAWVVLLAALPLLASGAALFQAVQGVALLTWSVSFDDVTLALRLNGVAALLVVVTQLIGVVAALYTAGLCRLDESAGRSRWLWPLWGVLLSSLSVIWLAADLLSLYLGLELMGLTAVGMLLLSGKAEALLAGLRYLLVALVGSLLYLLGVALILAHWGSLELAQLTEVVAPEPVAWLAAALLGAGLATKAALFPLHAWLTPVHASAWTPVSALHAALVVKASLYLLLMLWSLLIPESHVAPLLLGLLGALAIVWGSLAAWRADSLKTLVAASTVAQLGYLMLAFPLLLGPEMAPEVQTLAWQGFWLQLLGHALAKAAMFMAAGNLILATGESTLAGLAGTSRRLPLSLLVFGIASVTLMGLPPSAGFTAKWQLLQAMLLADLWWAIAALLLGTLLSAAYVFRLFRYSFIESAPRKTYRPLAPGMEGGALLLALAALLLGLWAHYPLSLLQGASA